MKNSATAKSSAVVTAARPVRAPSRTPAADSILVDLGGLDSLSTGSYALWAANDSATKFALLTGTLTISKIDTINCAQPHEAEVFGTGELNPDRDQPYPTDDQQTFARVESQCSALLADRPDVVQRFGVLPVVADEHSWNSFRGRYVCVAIPYGGGTTTGSIGL